MTSKPFVRRTFANLTECRVWFFGSVVYTRVHTPRLELQSKAPVLLLFVVSVLRAAFANQLIYGWHCLFLKLRNRRICFRQQKRLRIGPSDWVAGA